MAVDKRLLERAIIREGATIRDALLSLNESACQIVLVPAVQEALAKGRIVGLMTDGDLRRAMLSGATLDDGIGPHVHRTFTSVEQDVRRVDVLDLMRALRISEVPILDKEGQLVGLHLM